MRVLDIANHFPYPPNDGERIPVFSYLRSLSQKGIQYTLLTPMPESREEWEAGLKVFEGWGIKVVGVEDRRGGNARQALRCLGAGHVWINRGFEPALAAKARELLAGGGWDIVQAETVVAGQHLPRQIGFPSLLMALDSLSAGHLGELWRTRHRFGDWINMRRTAALERSVYRRFDRITAISLPDAAAIMKLAPGKSVDHLPNGVDLDLFKAATEQEEGELLVFTGAMDFPPNIDAMEWFVNEIWPRIKNERPEARLAIVGKDPVDAIRRMAERDMSISVTGRVESVAQWLAKAAVVIAPIRMGTGMKNKVLEGAAVGKAIVTTGKGLENIDLRAGEDLILANDPAAFAKAAIRLLGNQPERRRLGRNAGKQIEQKYSREAAAEKLMTIYFELIKRI